MASMRPRLGMWLAASAVIMLLVIGYRVTRNALQRDPHAVLRDSVLALRASTESCLADVDAGVAAMREFNRTLDSMRTRVRDMEGVDRRGVAIDSYRVYLEAFTAYNDSAAGWGSREDSVRALDGRCRELAEHHNMLADSLRRALLARQRRR